MSHSYALSLFAALLAGCVASAPVYELSDVERAKYAQTDPGELLAKSQSRLKQAEADELPLFAPKSYVQAKAALEKAAKARQADANADTIVASVGAAEHYLDTAYNNKEKSRSLLAANYLLDKRLQELDAPKVAASAYKGFLSDLADIYEQVDKGEMAGAEKGRAALTADQQKLKIELTKGRALAELIALHEKLDDDDVSDVVPIALNEAEIAFEKAERFIEANVDDAEGIVSAVQGARVFALRAQWMAARAYHLAEFDTKSDQVEQIILEEEKWLGMLGAGIGGDPVRHLPADEQAVALAYRARELNEKLAEFRGTPEAAKPGSKNAKTE